MAARSKAVEVMKNKIAEGCPAIDREEVSPIVLMGVRRIGCRYVDVYVCRYGVHEERKVLTASLADQQILAREHHRRTQTVSTQDCRRTRKFGAAV